MDKKQLGPTTNLFPMPALLVAVKTGEGKANILTVAWAGIVGGKPALMAIEIGQSHYSTPFIEAEGSFTVNVPGAALAAATDYCGMVSGSEDPDKAATCGLTFSPSARIASPLIAECPLNFECVIVDRIRTAAGVFYLVEIVETHADAAVLDGKDNVLAAALNPLVFTPDGRYYALGEDLGPAWSIGERFR
jgi:flavin reductase (DIM6/NTAB) family NADH-FMN oxidoreductase RutF